MSEPWAQLRVVLGHRFGLTLSTLAEAAVAAASDAVIDGGEALKMAGDVVIDPVRLDGGGGVIAPSETPGLGATIDPDALERCRVRR